MSAPGQGGDAAQQSQNGQQGGEGQGEAQQQQAPAQPDFTSLSENVQKMSETQEQMRQFLAEHPALQVQQEQQAEQQQMPMIEAQQLEELGFATGDESIDGQTAQALSQLFHQQAEKVFAPYVRELADLKQEIGFERLVQEQPDLADPETAETMMKASYTIAEAMGNPEIAGKPEFVRLVHGYHQGLVAAQQEGVGTPEPAHLEGGGGAIPGGPQVDTRVDEIMNAGGKKGAGVLPFR